MMIPGVGEKLILSLQERMVFLTKVRVIKNTVLGKDFKAGKRARVLSDLTTGILWGLGKGWSHGRRKEITLDCLDFHNVPLHAHSHTHRCQRKETTNVHAEGVVTPSRHLCLLPGALLLWCLGWLGW